MISVKNLAEELGISTQAVYKYFKKYPELKEHKKGSDLDDEAADFIRSKSKPNPVIIVNQENLDKIEEYRKKYEQQLEKTQLVYEQINQMQKHVENANKQLGQLNTLETENGNLKIKLEASEKEVNELRPLTTTVEVLETENKTLREKLEKIEKLTLIGMIKYYFNKNK